MPTRNFYVCMVTVLLLSGNLSQERQYLMYGKIIYMKRQIKRRYLSIHKRTHARSGARSIKIDIYRYIS